MNKVFLTLLFAIFTVGAMLFENTLVAVPLVYLIGAFFLIFLRRVRIYITVFILAFFIDSLRVVNFGLTPLFLATLATIIFFYEKYSGSDDVVISSFLIAVSGIVYAHFLSYSVPLTVLFLTVAGGGWYAFSQFQKRGGFI